MLYQQQQHRERGGAMPESAKEEKGTTPKSSRNRVKNGSPFVHHQHFAASSL
jgi:hypothetical protein